MENRLGGGPRRGHRLSAQAVKNVTARGLHADCRGAISAGRAEWHKIVGLPLSPERSAARHGPRTAAADLARRGAREAQVWRKLRHKGGDPIEARRAEKSREAARRGQDDQLPPMRRALHAAHRVGWKNAKHAAQWPSPLAAYGYPIFGELAVQAVDVALVMKVLDPVWQKKPETVSRVRQRVESVRDWATAWKFRQRENPSRWRGHLENLLPSPREIRQVEHHAALPYGEVSAFVAALRAQPGAAARALKLVDIDRDPGLDDSTSLCGLMTAVCRPRLHLAPGFMLVAAQLSGSGSGKGLLDPARFV